MDMLEETFEGIHCTCPHAWCAGNGDGDTLSEWVHLGGQDGEDDMRRGQYRWHKFHTAPCDVNTWVKWLAGMDSEFSASEEAGKGCGDHSSHSPMYLFIP